MFICFKVILDIVVKFFVVKCCFFISMVLVLLVVLNVVLLNIISYSKIINLVFIVVF